MIYYTKLDRCSFQTNTQLQRMAKIRISIPVQSCNSPNGAKNPFLHLCSKHLIFSRREFDLSLLSLYVLMRHTSLTLLSFRHPPPCMAGCGGASLTPSGHQRTSLQSSSQSSCVARWSWAMVNIQVILTPASAEARFNSKQLRGNTNFRSKSQKKAVASL